MRMQRTAHDGATIRRLPYPGVPDPTKWTSTKPAGELVTCAACEGTGRLDSGPGHHRPICGGCNGAGKQRV